MIADYCRAGVLVLLVGAVAGCTYVSPRQPTPLSSEPLLLDQAMQLRSFERSTAWYENGAVVAGSVPIGQRPRMTRVYHGARFEPTHTAQPPLEGEIHR